MALQNIGAGNKDDPFYRYQMPTMIPKIEGRGNGIKTNVVNMVDIAKALGRPGAYITKYFGCELGAQSKFEEKSGTSLVNGSHDTSKLKGLLENFINKYVQCYECKNPETEIIITKTQMITLKCAACGHLSDVDTRDKLTAFIIKNPPEKKSAKDKKAMRRAEKERLKPGEAVDEEQKKLKREVVKKGNYTKDTSSNAPGKKKVTVSDEDSSRGRSQVDEMEAVIGNKNDDDYNVQWQTDTSAEASRQRIQEQLSAVTAGMVMLNTTERAKSGKNSPMSEEKPEVNDHSNGAATISSTPHETLVLVIKDYLKKRTPASQLKPFLVTLPGAFQQVVDALFEAMFDGAGKGFSKEVTKKKNYLAAATEIEGSQLSLLNALEAFCRKASSDAVKEVALALKVLYDNDVLDEEFIVHWYEKGQNGGNKASPIWKNVKPFVEWLQSAESETEAED